MPRLICSCLLLLGAAASAPADQPSLKSARQRWLRGNYDEARAQYDELAHAPKVQTAAVLGLSHVFESQGHYEKALSVLLPALKAAPKDPDLLARQAEMLASRGRWPEAETAAESALTIAPDHFLARWVRATVWRDRGELKKADAEFRWFVRTYSDRSERDNDIKDPDALLLVGRAACENARWHNLPDQYSFILNEVYADALRLDKDLWLAEYHAGMLLLEKYQRGEALGAFDKVLAINSNAAEALVGKGVAALIRLEIKDAESFAAQALKINDNLPEAHRLLADVHLASGDVPAAIRELERARTINPRDELTLGRIAACLLLQKKQHDYDQLEVEVARHNPSPGVFFLVLAEQLEARRWFDEAERLYLKAMQLRPMLPEARNALGMLHMRLGREDDARVSLTRAFEYDSFNVRVSNMLKVLRHLEKYATLKTDHFELRYDPQADRHLARSMSKLLEQTYVELAARFQYSPPGPILVEVFTTHEKFSGRTIALPDLHTIGACTGRVVAMVSPQSKDLRKPFNWARVLRHELVHIFNLEQTKFQVPHWFTEGLAVINEGGERPQAWNQLLLRRVPAGDLLTLDTIDLGFIRPRSPEEWTLAYCQAQLYVEFLEARYGQPAIGQMLEAFKDGLDAGTAVSRVCKVDKALFEKGYRTHLEEEVRKLGGIPSEKPRSFLQVQRLHEQKPDDLDNAAHLAEEYALRRRNAEARKLVDNILSQSKHHPVASYVKARMLQNAGEDEEAKKILEAALDPKHPNVKVLAALGRMAFEAKNMAKAAEIYELAHRSQPYESKWLTELARVYTQSGDRDQQIRVLKALVPSDPDDLPLRKRLARLLLESKRPQEAELCAQQALEIDVVDLEALLLLADACLEQKKSAAAIEACQVVLEIDARGETARAKLARAYYLAGRKPEAAAEVAKVLAVEPNNVEARRVEQLLKE